MNLILNIILAACCASVLHAKSDTDVTILEAKSVEIREDQVIIVGSATIVSRMIDKDGGGAFLDRSSSFKSISTDATFIIKKPLLNWNGPDSEEKTKYEKMSEESWQMTLKEAANLKAGMEVGRIGYGQPTITIDKSMIVKIEGFGYLYPKPKK